MTIKLIEKDEKRYRIRVKYPNAVPNRMLDTGRKKDDRIQIYLEFLDIEEFELSRPALEKPEVEVIEIKEEEEDEN